jgi:hypothetical protein
MHIINRNSYTIVLSGEQINSAVRFCENVLRIPCQVKDMDKSVVIQVVRLGPRMKIKIFSCDLLVKLYLFVNIIINGRRNYFSS